MTSRFAGLLTYSGLFAFPPYYNIRKWHEVINKPHNELTAAGLSGTSTRFPFHPPPRQVVPGGIRNKTVAKVLKKRIPSNRFFDLYQEKARFPATKGRFACRKRGTAVPLQCHKEQKRFSF